MSNITKALETLLLPTEMGVYDGLLTSPISKRIVLERTTDFTKRIGTRPTITDVWKVESQPMSSTNFYALNMLRFRLDDNGVIVDTNPDNFIIEKERAVITITVGPFAGYTYWYPSRKTIIKPNSDGSEYIVETITDIGKNTTRTGYPEPTNGVNPLVSITQRDIIITTTKTSSATKQTDKPLLEILQGLNVTYEDLKTLMTSTAFIKKADTNTRITNTSVEGIFTTVTPGVTKVNAKVYYNGIDTEVKKPSGMITSYNKTYPGHVVRYRLYDTIINEPNYGASAVATFDSSINDEITIVQGTTPGYDATTKTLTFNPEEGATLWVTFEELPAQGKNWGNEAIYFLTDSDVVRIS